VVFLYQLLQVFSARLVWPARSLNLTPSETWLASLKEKIRGRTMESEAQRYRSQC
jgi:hypothetical protein